MQLVFAALKVCFYGCSIVWLLMVYVHVKEMVSEDSRQSLSNTLLVIAEFTGGPFHGGVRINIDTLECIHVIGIASSHI